MSIFVFLKTIEIASIYLDSDLKSEEITALRGAVIKTVGKGDENILFHQHTEEGKSVYKYPLIQYKIFTKNIFN